MSSIARPRRLPVPQLALAALGIALLAAFSVALPGHGVPAAMPAMAVVLFASLLSSIAGFAFSAICGGILLRLIPDPVQAVQVLMVCSIAIQAYSVSRLWNEIAWPQLGIFVLGGIAGLPVGVWLLLHVGQFGFREIIGGLLTLYALHALLRRPIIIQRAGPAADLVIGCLSGITGGLAAFPGAAITPWCGMRGWNKQAQRGIFQPFILLMQGLGLALIRLMQPAHAAAHPLGAATLAFIPAALLGTWCGLSIFGRLSDRAFTLCVNLLLLASGLTLLA